MRHFIPKRQKSHKIYTLDPYYSSSNRNNMDIIKGQKIEEKKKITIEGREKT